MIGAAPAFLMSLWVRARYRATISLQSETVEQWLAAGVAHIAFKGHAVLYHGGRGPPHCSRMARQDGQSAPESRSGGSTNVKCAWRTKAAEAS